MTYKLITLNIWGGHFKTPLLDFIDAHNDIDIFCLQEVYHNAKEKISTNNEPVTLDIFSQIQSILPQHIGYFKPVVDGIYGLAIFIKNTIKIIDNGEIKIYTNKNYLGRGPAHSRILQWIKCQIDHQTYVIINLHGLWNGQGKTDTPDRIKQSKRIKKFTNNFKNPVILCGDFNLSPDTESIKIIAANMNNLVNNYNIQSTRTHWYSKSIKFADYIFTSSEIKINEFRVLNEVVSDHTPLLLNFL